MMRKTLITLFAVPFLISSASAQKFYLKAGAGYAYPQAGQTLSSSYWPLNGSVSFSSSTGELSSFEVKGASLGAGLQGIAGAGFRINNHVAVELNGLIGISNRKFSGTKSFPTQNGAYISETYTLYAKTPVFINPAIVIQTGDRLNLYARGGLLLPIKTKVVGEFSGSISLPGYYPLRFAGTREIKTGFSLGYAGAIGISLEIFKHTSFWLEGGLNSISIYAKEETLTEYTEDGKDKMHIVSEEEKNITFKSKGKSDGTYPTYTIPFSTIGLNAGFSFQL